MGELFLGERTHLWQPAIDGGTAPRGRAMRTKTGRSAHGPSGIARQAKAPLSAPHRRQRRHLCPIAPSRLAERISPPARPDEVWQADITYIETREGWLYLAGVLDACSRKIVGWAADDAMPTGLAPRAFERAIAQRNAGAGLLRHSDRGSQYASDAYRELLRRCGVTPSMSRKGNGCDNAKMESFWATLKSELVDGRIFALRAEAKSEIFPYIEVFYNRARLHGAIGFQSPVDFENQPS
jgi:putative transposase